MGRRDEYFLRGFWNSKNAKIISVGLWYNTSVHLFLLIKDFMNLERYEFFADDTLTHFEFVSEGPKGKVKKMIRFIPRYADGATLFHLSFGDWNEKKRQIDDLTKTNNHDPKKVLATVAAAVLAFTEQFPDMSVYATGSTPARTRLYQMGIASHWQEIESKLYVSGFRKNKWEPFIKGVKYEAFLVRKR
jgi:hypothetical protein